jgi:hypothetical protein
MHCSLRRPIDSSSTASWIDLHPAGPGDGLITSMAMAVAVLNAGGRRLELAVLTKDVTLLRKTFNQP